MALQSWIRAVAMGVVAIAFTACDRSPPVTDNPADTPPPPAIAPATDNADVDVHGKRLDVEVDTNKPGGGVDVNVDIKRPRDNPGNP